MDFKQEVHSLLASLKELEENLCDTLILNPVENIPKSEFLLPSISKLHGLYNTDKQRNDAQKIETKIQFSGRGQITTDIQKIYSMWNKVLGSECISMRLFSGLHAHAVIFMALTGIGDKILLLPEAAGGHMATKSILERLGADVFEMPIDIENRRIDINKSKELIDEIKPKIIFVDRSEGLTYEDFSWLGEYESAYKIFDASQYLTNIISKDYINPFDMGFDSIISTLHKNLPGPQRALFCSKKKDTFWESYNSKIGIYVSNMHPYAIYSAGLMFEDMCMWKKLSRRMLENTLLLEEDMKRRGIPIVYRDPTQVNTHHIWINCDDKYSAYRLYSDLERIGLLVNYRLLPYNLGYGVRIGLSAATYSGLCRSDMNDLGELIARVFFFDYSESLKTDSIRFIRRVKENEYFAKG